MNWIAAAALAAALASPAVKAPPPEPARPKCSNAAALYCPGHEPTILCRFCGCADVLVIDRCGACLHSVPLCTD